MIASLDHWWEYGSLAAGPTLKLRYSLASAQFPQENNTETIDRVPNDLWHFVLWLKEQNLPESIDAENFYQDLILQGYKHDSSD